MHLFLGNEDFPKFTKVNLAIKVHRTLGLRWSFRIFEDFDIFIIYAG